mmetsp:Transcript_15813/g.45536  ORF Transcript_15813/g.45536 Transcript_15813/m.45536 type:complete len:306 (+) Transcript_15813:2672-3589(+)
MVCGTSITPVEVARCRKGSRGQHRGRPHPSIPRDKTGGEYVREALQQPAIDQCNEIGRKLHGSGGHLLEGGGANYASRQRCQLVALPADGKRDVGRQRPGIGPKGGRCAAGQIRAQCKIRGIGTLLGPHIGGERFDLFGFYLRTDVAIKSLMDQKRKQRRSRRHRSHFGKLISALRWHRRCCAVRCPRLRFRQGLLGSFPFLQYFDQKLRPAGHRCFVLVLLLPRCDILECIPKVGRAFAAIAMATPIALVAALGWPTACQDCPTGVAAGDQIRRYHRRSWYGQHGLILLDLPRGTDLTAHGPIV